MLSNLVLVVLDLDSIGLDNWIIDVGLSWLGLWHVLSSGVLWKVWRNWDLLCWCSLSWGFALAGGLGGVGKIIGERNLSRSARAVWELNPRGLNVVSLWWC